MINSPMSRRVDSEHQFAESELDIEFGVVNQEGDASLPSFSTDVSDEEGVQKHLTELDFKLLSKRNKFRRTTSYPLQSANCSLSNVVRFQFGRRR